MSGEYNELPRLKGQSMPVKADTVKAFLESWKSSKTQYETAEEQPPQLMVFEDEQEAVAEKEQEEPIILPPPANTNAAAPPPPMDLPPPPPPPARDPPPPAPDTDSTFDRAYEFLILYVLTTLTQWMRSAGWAGPTRASKESYKLRDGSMYAIPQWYVSLRNTVAIASVPLLFIVLALVAIWWSTGWVAHQMVSQDRYYAGVVHKLAILDAKTEVELYVRRYREIGQASVADIETSSATGGTASSVAEQLMFGVDEDGNNLDDDIESHAMEQLIDDAMRTENGKKPLAESNKNAVVRSPTLARRVAVEVSGVCGVITQFDKEKADFKRVRGCFDVMKFMLDRMVNPRYTLKLIDEYLKSQKDASSTTSTGKKYLASRSLLNRDSAMREMQTLKTSILGSQFGDDRDINCICSDHLGIAEPFVYVGKKDEPALLIIEPRLEPLTGKYLERARDGGLVRAQLKYRNSSLRQDECDAALWRQIHYSPEIKQPPTGIKISYKTLPDESTMIKYYGGIEGDPIMAYLNAYSTHKQERRNYEYSSMHNQTYWSNMFNSIAHRIDAYNYPDTHERNAYIHIMDARMRTQNRRFDNERQRQKEPSKTLKQMAVEFMNSYGDPLKLSSEVPARVPPLEHKKGVSIENTAYSGCILHCMAQREGLVTRRQQWRNYLSIGDDAISKRTVEPEEILFRYN